MLSSRTKLSLKILILSIISLFAVRSYFRHFDSQSFKIHDKLNTYIYYYVVLIIPALLFLAYKLAYKIEKVKYLPTVSYFLAFINLILILVYFYLFT